METCQPFDANFIGINFIKAVDMTAEEAETNGYCTRGETGDGVEVTYPDDSKKWMPAEFFANHFTPIHNEELASTCEMMVSEDYKERFKAEYIQLKNRFVGLTKMIVKWDDNMLSFTPTCPRATYNFQLRAMRDYLDILEVRAKIENIDLN